MNLALATCENLPDWEVDDHPLISALAQRNITVSLPEWSNPNVDWSSFDLIVIRTTWDYQDRLDDFLKWTQRVGAHGRLRNSAALVKWNANKHYLKDLSDRGVPIAPTLWLTKEVDIAQEAIRLGWNKLFIKPMVGASAIGAMRFSLADTARAQELLCATLPKCGMMLQPYIESVEHEGEVSLLFFGDRFSHAVVKVPPNGDFRVQDDYGAKDYPYEPDAHLRLLADEAIKALPESPLYARVDFLKYAGSWVLNELELIEPSLFFRHDVQAPHLFAEVIISEVELAQR